MFLNIFQSERIGSKRPEFSASIDQIRDAITQMIRARDELGFEMYFGTSTPLCLDERLILEKLAFRCGAGEWFGSFIEKQDSGRLDINCLCNVSEYVRRNIRRIGEVAQ